MMVLAADCPETGFNIAVTSGYYAQMTGLLAGFAFTAMVVLLTPVQVGERASGGKAKDNGVLLALFTAFVCLVITTLTYSVLAGETAARGRAATEELTDGLPFGLAVIMLFHGVTLLMHSGNIDHSAVLIGRVITTVVAPSLTLYYLTNGAADTESIRLASTGVCGVSRLPQIGVVLSLVLFAILTIALIPRVQAMVWRSWSWPRDHQYLVPAGVLTAGVLAAVAAGDLTTRSANFLLPRWAVTTYLVGAFILLAVIGLMLAFGYPVDDPRYIAPDDHRDVALPTDEREVVGR
jgi:hypothetical protein